MDRRRGVAAIGIEDLSHANHQLCGRSAALRIGMASAKATFAGRIYL
jgi:hypothetical protein